MYPKFAFRVPFQHRGEGYAAASPVEVTGRQGRVEYDGSSSCFSEIAICDGPLVFFNKFKHFVSSVAFII